jgi:hypothetical protein
MGCISKNGIPTLVGVLFFKMPHKQTMEEKNMLGKVPCNYIGNIGTSLYTTIDQPTIPIVLVKLGSSHHEEPLSMCFHAQHMD